MMHTEARSHYTSRHGPVVSTLLSELQNQAQLTTDNPDLYLNMHAKLAHTGRVVSMTDRLMREMNGVIEGDEYNGERWNIPMADTIAWWHDGARFMEIASQGRVNSKGYNHSEEGAKLFARYFDHPSQNWEQYSQEAADLGIDFEVVKDAIGHHSLRDYEGNNPYARLIRDADKLDICRNVPAIIQTFIKSDKLIDGREITPEALREFIEFGYVNNDNVHTVADGLLRISSWYRGLNFGTSRRLWHEFGIDEQISRELSARGISLNLQNVLMPLVESA